MHPVNQRERLPYQAIKTVVAVVAFVLVLRAPVVLAFGDDGHKIVGEIAWQRLSPAARTEVKRILESDPEYERFYESCIWADKIKSEGSWNWARRLHYVNIAKDAGAYVETRDCQEKQDCPDGIPCPSRNCVVAAIGYYRDVLKDPNSSDPDKLVALKFLGHFVGDVHQPLHAGFAHDKGGNDVRVLFFNNKTNLHRVWDSGMIRQSRKRWFDYARELSQSITADQHRAWTATLDPADWATESHKLVPEVYADIPRSAEIGEVYYREKLPMLEEQIKKGGVRLAALLNSVFAD